MNDARTRRIKKALELHGYTDEPRAGGFACPVWMRFYSSEKGYKSWEEALEHFLRTSPADKLTKDLWIATFIEGTAE